MISTKGRYAVRMLLDIADQEGDSYVRLCDVAKRQEISEKYLQHVAKRLVSAGLITGASGRGGGYRLARPASEILVLEVLEAAEGTLAPVSCLDPDAPACPRRDGCKTLPMWERHYAMLKEYFGGISLDSLANG